MAPHSSTLAWKIPWMEEPDRLQSMGSLTVRHNWVTSLSLFTFMHWRRKCQPTSLFLPGESHGLGEPGGLPSMGSHRVRHNWSDLPEAAPAKGSFLKIESRWFDLKIPWKRAWLPTPVLLPGEFHGLRNLAGYSPCSQKESDTTELLSLSLTQTHTHTHTHRFNYSIISTLYTSENFAQILQCSLFQAILEKMWLHGNVILHNNHS